MADITEIIKGIQQAAANGFDGGKEVGGLSREEPTPITDKRVIDGFGVRVQGDVLVVNYHQEIPLSKSQPNRLQSDCDQTLEDIVSFLKKEYKIITGETLSLSELDKESDVHSEYINRQRLATKAVKRWKIGGLNDLTKQREEDSETPSLDDAFEDFLKQGKPEFVQDLI
tara:strand:+ start:1820 stop:2329 length:510 start_codon:yes stop_codon:yes gene_type:complete